MKNLSLKYKLSGFFLLGGLTAIVAVGLLSFNSAKEALTQQTYKQLDSIRSAKASQVENHFRGIQIGRAHV